MILNPIVEINDVAVDTWETFLVTFNTPWYNTHQSCSAINVADKRATRITLACIFARWGNWSTTLIERRLICMWKASANLILINPETVVREQTLKTFSFDSNLSWSQKWTVINEPWLTEMVRWLKKSSNEAMTRANICIWFWDGSKFEPFIFPYCFLEILITCFFLVRKFWDDSKFEEKLNSWQKWFEFWAISTISS